MTFHYLLMASHAIYNKKLMEMLSDTGLTAGQPKVLDYLGDYDGASQKEIAAHCYVSPRHLTRIFLQICGVTPGKKVTRCRIDRAFILLSESKSSIRTIAESLGFADVSHFCRVFRHAAALTPNEYRRQLSTLNRQGISADLISAPVQQTNNGRREQ